MDDNQKKALSAALGQIEKQFGKGSVMRLGDSAIVRDVPVVSTGSLGSMSRSASAACPAAGWSRSTARSPRARRP
jgi:hypothetical protein